MYVRVDMALSLQIDVTLDYLTIVGTIVKGIHRTRHLSRVILFDELSLIVEALNTFVLSVGNTHLQ